MAKRETKAERSARAAEVLRRLDEQYGTEFRCYLEYETPWQLLIAVIFYQGNLWLLGSVHAKSYLPYQNYLVHRIFDLPSTGRERLNQQAEAEQQ